MLKPDFGNFQHYFTSVWDVWNCVVVWTFFVIAFPWDWNENWSFLVVWPPLNFPNLLAYWAQHFHSIIRMWNSSTGIPSPPLALFVVMLPKAHLTSHSRMSGSRWVITPSWLSTWALKIIFVQFFCVFLLLLLNIFCFCQVHTISVLYLSHLCMKCSLGISKFLEEISSLSHSIVFLYFSSMFFFALITEKGFLIFPCHSLEFCI